MGVGIHACDASTGLLESRGISRVCWLTSLACLVRKTLPKTKPPVTTNPGGLGVQAYVSRGLCEEHMPSTGNRDTLESHS